METWCFHVVEVKLLLQVHQRNIPRIKGHAKLNYFLMFLFRKNSLELYKILV